jgi:8-oxo-dGTP diphosphatase
VAVELCDIYNEAGERTGRVVARGTDLEAGAYYLVVHIWLRDEQGAYLIQQRAQHLRWAPGVWAVTGGYAQTGEDSLGAALREVQEELGLSLAPSSLRFLDRVFKQDVMQDIYLVEGARDAFTPLILDADVAAARWASKAEILAAARQGGFYRYAYLEKLLE